ncbi:MAG: hypothetical protein RLZZ267_1470 [Bacillota bacterium]|jgi:hypothetical protein
MCFVVLTLAFFVLEINLLVHQLVIELESIETNVCMGGIGNERTVEE